jgi:hypothetical protein
MSLINIHTVLGSTERSKHAVQYKNLSSTTKPVSRNEDLPVLRLAETWNVGYENDAKYNDSVVTNHKSIQVDQRSPPHLLPQANLSRTWTCQKINWILSYRLKEWNRVGRHYYALVFLRVLNYNFAYGSVCVWNLVSDIKGGTWTESV